MKIFPTRPTLFRIAYNLSPKFGPWHRAQIMAVLQNNIAKQQAKVESDRISEA